MGYELKIVSDKEVANHIFTQGSLTGDTNSKNYTQKNFDKSWPGYLVFMVLYDGEDVIAFGGAKDYGKFARIFDRWFVFPEYRQCGLGDNEWCKQFIIPLMEHIGDRIPFISMEFARRRPVLQKAVDAWNEVLPADKELHILDGLYETVNNSWQNIAIPKSVTSIDLPYKGDVQFKTVEPGKVWICDDFLSQSELNHVLKEWEEFKEWEVLEQQPDAYHVSNIHYSFERLDPTTFSPKDKIIESVVNRLNPLYRREFNEAAPKYNLDENQFYFKEHEIGKSRFDLHAEPTPDDIRSFGHCVFLLYLTDETDGAIICPSESDAKEAGMIDEGFIDGVKGISIDWVKETIETLPKVNRCIVIKNGTPHHVPVCSGRRKCISGWSFLPVMHELKTRDSENES